MVSPGKLRAVQELKDGDREAFEPTIDETGRVSYPFAEDHVDDRDGEPVEVLEALADRGVLASAFQHKVYVCPGCAAEGLQYSTGCPHCGSVHAIRERAAVHTACETTFEPDRREGQEDTPEGKAEGEYCPACDEDVPPDDLEVDRRYRCQDCASWFDEPTHRLWCRECPRVYAPGDAHERALYRYPLTDAGIQWVTSQVAGRRSLAETLEARGYETRVDTSVRAPAGETVPVHVYAEDDLLDDRIVADVHSRPTTGDVRRLLEAAGDRARPIIALTDGEVDERVAGLVDAEDVTVVSATEEGFAREYAVTDGPEESTQLLDRLGSLFSSSS
ncbi:TackOD1 domain-containing metal-binding protein [Natrialbaceae archaeon A-gly3]